MDNGNFMLNWPRPQFISDPIDLTISDVSIEAKEDENDEMAPIDIKQGLCAKEEDHKIIQVCCVLIAGLVLPWIASKGVPHLCFLNAFGDFLIQTKYLYNII